MTRFQPVSAHSHAGSLAQRGAEEEVALYEIARCSRLLFPKTGF